MFRALLVLTLMLPTLLMPQGMCVCQIVPIQKRASNSPSVPEDGASRAHAAASERDCSCESCRFRPSSPDAGDEFPGNPPPQGPSKHVPGCPAEFGAAPLTLLISGVEFQPDLFATDVDLTALAVGVFSLPRAASFPSPVVSPPLFISLCTLRI